MKRPLRPDEARLWSAVAATVRPAPGRAPPAPVRAPANTEAASAPSLNAAPFPSIVGPRPPSLLSNPVEIEPNRRRRIVRSRDGLAARLDLHGYSQDGARARLYDFLLGAQAEGARAVLVITGKGLAGEGVLRRRTPEWLADPSLRSVVAGLSPADDRHGGAGAWYVALKRLPR